MAFPFRLCSSICLLATVLVSSSTIACASDFNQNFDITWGNGRARVLNSGQLLTLSLDKFSGSGFQSKNKYGYGNIDMQIKLVPGNSAGTVTAYFLRSEGSLWDEIDFEFLGNVSGQPYTVHTNVYSQGKGDREEQFRLWYDPTADFHTYSFSWNPQRILFLVDGIPIRQFSNMESIGVPFPKAESMRLYSSLWCADDWATRGGLVKTDWSRAPFTAQYRSFNANSRTSQQLGATRQQRLAWVRREYMIYNYCKDRKRFPQGLPKECTVQGSY